MNSRIHVFIEGKVQGVFYRLWTKENADSLNLTGWVKNLEDGRVEACFEGEKEKLEEMVDKCRNGPDLAEVSHIDVVWEGYSGEFSNFEIR